jgi:hypothetical protein
VNEVNYNHIGYKDFSDMLNYKEESTRLLVKLTQRLDDLGHHEALHALETVVKEMNALFGQIEAFDQKKKELTAILRAVELLDSGEASERDVDDKVQAWLEEKRIDPGTKIIEISSGMKHEVEKVIKTNNRYDYGVYLYQLKGTSLALYRSEFKIA